MSDLLILGGITVAVILLSLAYAEWKLSKRIDDRGDHMSEAWEEGPEEAIEEMLEHKSSQCHETEKNMLTLTEGQIFAVLGMSRHPKLSIEAIEHERGYPVVEVHIEERLKKFAPPPVGFYYTEARHTREIEIIDLDDLLGEDVITVEGDHGLLKALGISTYEERTEEDVLGDEIHVTYEREWHEDESVTYDCKFTVEEKRKRHVDRTEILWDESGAL